MTKLAVACVAAVGLLTVAAPARADESRAAIDGG
jgi:hypothetical protein